MCKGGNHFVCHVSDETNTATIEVEQPSLRSMVINVSSYLLTTTNALLSGLHRPRKIEGVRGFRKQHLYWGCMKVSGFQITYSLGL